MKGIDLLNKTGGPVNPVTRRAVGERNETGYGRDKTHGLECRMDIDQDRIKQLVNTPGESLAVELKQWISLDEPEGLAKVVKTVLALRNFGGGYMVIGFHDKTLKPDTANAPEDVQVAFHIDTIQALISKFASEPFEVALEFPERDGQRYPVIVVPSGNTGTPYLLRKYRDTIPIKT